MEIAANLAPTPATDGTAKIQKFSMRGKPLLASGTSFDALATAENLWLAVKVYSRGGENELHAHTVCMHTRSRIMPSSCCKAARPSTSPMAARARRCRSRAS